ncbi:MAG: hypothetical protein AB7G06_06360 [Bdellovibrionales bacterium]
MSDDLNGDEKRNTYHAAAFVVCSLALFGQNNGVVHTQGTRAVDVLTALQADPVAKLYLQALPAGVAGYERVWQVARAQHWLDGEGSTRIVRENLMADAIMDHLARSEGFRPQDLRIVARDVAHRLEKAWRPVSA